MSAPLILFDNRLLDGTLTASTTAAGFNVHNVRDLRPYTWWRAANTNACVILVDCGRARPASCLGVTGHNFHSAGASILVQHSMDNATWTWAFPEFVPSSNRALLRSFPESSARFWRLHIAATTVAPQAAVIMIGREMRFPRHVSGRGTFSPRTDAPQKKSAVSKRGHLLGATVDYTEITADATFSNISEAWVTSTFEPFWDTHGGLGRPFFWVWNTTLLPASVLFARFADSYTYRKLVPGDTGQNLDLRMVAIKE